ncbi:MAG: Integration host factor subunit beta [Alphaproteobacteria bacterium ADurb.Bin438]|nr:MAG: Integration host factor subunit beta [Alphaproteobacteria bacterium ADurb.Bin438]
MTRSDIVMKLLELNPHLSMKDAEVVVETVFDKISETLIEGGRVEIRGLGVFEIRQRASRKLFNPLTQKIDIIKGKKVPFFKMAKKLKEEIND